MKTLYSTEYNKKAKEVKYKDIVEIKEGFFAGLLATVVNKKTSFAANSAILEVKLAQLDSDLKEVSSCELKFIKRGKLDNVELI